MSFVSLRNCTFIVNGHQVEGWADEDEALTFPSTTIANVTRGADGKMLASSTGNHGGPVEIKLLPNSKSTAYFARKVAFVKRGGRVTFDAEFSDPHNNVNVVLTNGVLTDVMDAPSLGQGSAGAVTFTIEFEQIISDYDTNDFDAAPSVSNEIDDPSSDR